MQAPLVEPATETTPATAAELPVGWRRRLLLLLAIVALAGGIIATLAISRHKIAPQSNQSLPLTSTNPSTLRLTGTTQAARVRSIQAPALAGEKVGNLRIISLRTAGTRVKQGDLLVEFDRQSQLRDFFDKQAENSKLTDDVLQEQAKEAAAQAKDETEIKSAEGDLSKAELEMQKIEILSRIDAETARATLDEAKATLNQLKTTFNLKRKSASASIRMLELQRDRARETMEHAQANAALMQVHSPIGGIVVLNTIWKQGNIGEVQEGDQVRPGVPFMQVVDPSAMQVKVAVNQQDLFALRDGAKGSVHLDAYPDFLCPAQLQTIDPVGRPGDFSDKVRSFAAIWALLCTDARLLPDLSASVDTLPNDQVSDDQVSNDRVPNDQVPGKQVPGKQVPGKQVQ